MQRINAGLQGNDGAAGDKGQQIGVKGGWW